MIFKLDEEMQRQINDLVINLEIAQKLYDAGLSEKSVFGYFKDAKNEYVALLQDENNSGLPAYTSGELATMLPAGLEIDEYTWKATSKNWARIESPYGYPIAHFHTIKDDETYYAGYYYENAMIAFSKNEEGLFNNLLLHSENEQDARALLLLELIRERKIFVQELQS